MPPYIIYTIKKTEKRRFCRLLCKNAAEAKKKFTLFANYRINSLSFQFFDIVVLQLIESFYFIVQFKSCK